MNISVNFAEILLTMKLFKVDLLFHQNDLFATFAVNKKEKSVQI